jgi:hypothetical protein
MEKTIEEKIRDFTQRRAMHRASSRTSFEQGDVARAVLDTKLAFECEAALATLKLQRFVDATKNAPAPKGWDAIEASRREIPA